MLKHLVSQDVLSGKRRIAPLGCVVLCIGVLFIGACILGWYALLTSNVTRLAEPAAVAAAVATETSTPIPPTLTLTPTRIAASPTPSPISGSARVTATMTALASARTTPSRTPTKTVTSVAKPNASVAATQGITWTVRPIPGRVDPSGTPVYDAPPEIKAWVVKDFLTFLNWWRDHMFEKDYLLANIHLYTTGKLLAQWKTAIPQEFASNRISASLLDMRRSAPYDQPRVSQFFLDGRRAALEDYTRAGEYKFYDTRTRQPLPGFQGVNCTWVYQMDFSSADKRWKVERILMTLNTDTLEVIAKDSNP